MTDYLEAASVEQVPEGKAMTFTVGGVDVAIFNVGGTIYATEDTCLHKGMSLGSGELQGNVVTCRAHGWKYNVTTGSTLSSPGYGVSTYPVKIVDGKILVAIHEPVKPAE
jgi:nitrite reductase/ring-hydroxylating ferredoxin subunit